MSGLSLFPRLQSAYLGHVYMKNICVQFFKSNDCFLFWCLSFSLHLLTYLHNFFFFSSLILPFPWRKWCLHWDNKNKNSKEDIAWRHRASLHLMRKVLEKVFLLRPMRKYAHWWAILYKIDNKILKSYFLLWSTWDITWNLLSTISEKIFRCWALKR